MSPIQLVLAGVFWLCAAGVFYSYIGYPLLIWVLSHWFGRRSQAPQVNAENLPSISLLIAAYNEEAVIEERIRNALALDYPRERLEIVIASDGSSDGTPGLVQRFAGRGVRLLTFTPRRGKSSVLNAAFPQLTGEIVLMSDANTQYDPLAARTIVRWFQDPKVGVVCGRLVLTDPETGRNADSLYWKYETFLKKCEGRLRALLGANGGIYAIRRSLFVPIPNDTIVDDFVIPLRAKLRTACDILYDWEAVAREETPAGVGSEFHRRSRIGAGGFQSIGRLWKLLLPRQGWVAFTFFSHKILRWFCPFFLLGMLATNAFLYDYPFYRTTLFGQFAFYLLSLLAGLLPGQLRAFKPLRITTMFTGMNAALLVGFWRWLWGSQEGAWKRTARLAEIDGAIG